MSASLTVPFRGSTAVAAGLVTRASLRRPRYQRLFPDVYAPSGLDPDLALRARAAGVLVGGRGVVAGYAAAELLGASSGPADEPVDVLVPRSYRCAGLRVHRHRVLPDESVCVGPTTVTAPARTAFDLARWAPVCERVTAVDALGYACAVGPDEVRALRNRHLGARHGGRVAPVLALTNPRSESPMESRMRMALHLGGLPQPVVLHPVLARDTRYYLDLAYPELLLALEYDGAEHRSQRRARRDLIREAVLTALGWRILRFDADVVLFRPERIAIVVRAELASRGVG